MKRHDIMFAAVVLAAVGLALAALFLRSGEAAVAATVAGAEAARRSGALRRGARRDAKAEAAGRDPLRARKALSRASSEVFRAINATRATIDAAEREVREGRRGWG